MVKVKFDHMMNVLHVLLMVKVRFIHPISIRYMVQLNPYKKLLQTFEIVFSTYIRPPVAGTRKSNFAFILQYLHFVSKYICVPSTELTTTTAPSDDDVVECWNGEIND